MTNKERFMELMEAWFDGKQIQFNDTQNGWSDTTACHNLWEMARYSDRYRVKPETVRQYFARGPESRLTQSWPLRARVPEHWEYLGYKDIPLDELETEQHEN